MSMNMFSTFLEVCLCFEGIELRFISVCVCVEVGNEGFSHCGVIEV